MAIVISNVSCCIFSGNDSIFKCVERSKVRTFFPNVNVGNPFPGHRCANTSKRACVISAQGCVLHVALPRDFPKIFKPIIRRVFVNVVNFISVHSSQHFPYDAMSKNLFPGNPSLTVSAPMVGRDRLFPGKFRVPRLCEGFGGPLACFEAFWFSAFPKKFSGLWLIPKYVVQKVCIWYGHCIAPTSFNVNGINKVGMGQVRASQ